MQFPGHASVRLPLAVARVRAVRGVRVVPLPHPVPVPAEEPRLRGLRVRRARCVRRRGQRHLRGGVLTRAVCSGVCDVCLGGVVL